MKKKEAKNNNHELSVALLEKGVPEHERTSRHLFLFCAILLPFAVLAHFPSSISLRKDYDIWFHLAYGREYVQNLTWYIDHSQFSWTPVKAEWMYGTWLGSSLCYIIHELIGVRGLFIVHWLILATSAGVILRLARSSKVPIGIGLLTGLLVAAIVVSLAGQLIKPGMFSILMTTLTAVAYFKFRMAPGSWIIGVLPVIFLLWVNIHGLWFFGLAFLGLALSADLLENLLMPRQETGKKNLVLLSSAVGLAILATTANPDGIFYPVSVASLIFFPEDMGMLKNIIDMQSMTTHLLYSHKQPDWTLTAWLMVVMCCTHIALWLRSWKITGHPDLSSAAINIVFFLLGMYLARLTLVYSLIWLPSMIFLAWRTKSKPAFPNAGPLLFTVFLLLTALSAAKVAFLMDDRSWLGAGYRDKLPDREVAFIMDNNLPGPIFNDKFAGAYMMWAMYPDYKVFIDPRNTVYLDSVQRDYYKGIGGKEFPLNPQGVAAFIKKYPARIALISHANYQIALWLHDSPDWSLSYFEKNAAVLLHRDAGTKLSPEVRATSLSPVRFQNVSDSNSLIALFMYYNLYGSHFAEVIRDYYEQNIDDLVIIKRDILDEMDRHLSIKKQIEKGRQ